MRRELEPHPSSVAEARRAVRAALGELGDTEAADALDAAQLCVSELVTNAVVHAGTAIGLSVLVHPGGARVEVQDGSPHLPVPRNYSSLASTGRGLRMVDELATRWGVVSHRDTKTVWFEVGEPSGILSVTRDESPADTDVVAVCLQNVPLLIHSAWQMHAESLLREYLLVRLDEDALDDLGANAAASDAIALLANQIHGYDPGEDPEAVMAGAVEPLVSAEELVLEVPLASVEHFAILHGTLETAAGMADAGALLTPPTQPEIRDFRRWVCREVLQQAAGQAPTAWDPDRRYGPVPVSEALDWDPSEIRESPAPRIAADDAGTIVAVSPSAAAALGYDDADVLVGHRLVEVVPHRFRQAHLAGVTLHLFADRSALLDVPVTVPALRADGTELPVEVVVRSRQMPHGRRLFTADIGAAASA